MKCIALAILMAGCSSSTSTMPDLSVVPDLAITPDLAPIVFSLKGHLTDDVNGTSAGNIVPGAMVCRYPQMTPCALSNAAGNYLLDGLPLVADLAVAFKKTGLVTDIFPIPADFDINAPLNVSLLTSTNDVFVTATGKTQDSSKGMLILTLNATGGIGGAPAGTTLKVQPAGGDGPYYLDTSTNPFTSNTIGSVGRLGIILNLAPGKYTVTGGGASQSCTALFGWPASGGGVTGPSIEANSVLSIALACE